MSRNYAALPHEYLEEMEMLTDEQFGRLIRALLRFSATGRECPPEGPEAMLYRRVIRQELRFQESYDRAASIRSESARRAAEARWGGQRGKASDHQLAGNAPQAPSDPVPPQTDSAQAPVCPAPDTSRPKRSDADACARMPADARNANTKTDTETETKTETHAFAACGSRKTAPRRGNSASARGKNPSLTPEQNRDAMRALQNLMRDGKIPAAPEGTAGRSMRFYGT